MLIHRKPAFRPFYCFYFGFLFCLILGSCAIQGSGPSGGKKDTKAPKVKAELPANKSVNFASKKIIITFDEFVDLDNVFKEVIISPTLPKIPDITVGKKSVIVNFNSIVLQPNTTYSIQFGNAIKDVNEGNVLRNYRYVFSTGPYLDSLSIKGKVIDGLSHKPAAAIKIELYKTGFDSAIYKKKPLYYARADSFGKFKLDFLPKGTYQLYTLNDKNDNYFVDEGEDIGYPTGAITLDSAMVLKDSIVTFPYVAKSVILRRASLANHSLQLKFEHVVDSVQVYASGKRFFTSFERVNDAKDSFVYWMGESFPEMRIQAFYKDAKLDTIIKASDKTKPLKFSFDVTASGDNGNYWETPILLKSNKPVSNINLDKVILHADTLLAKGLTWRFKDPSQTLIELGYNYDESRVYKIKFLPGAVTSIFDEKNKDTAIYTLSIPSQKAFGKFEITTITDDGSYIFQLVNESGVVVFYKYVSRETLVKVPFVNPGKYTVRLVKDENKNGRWDGGDIKTKHQPEPVYYFPKVFNIKANWELAGIKFDLTKKSTSAPAKKP